MEELYEFDEDSLNEEELEEKRKRKKKKKKKGGKKDACYHKVRSRYDVWPSAYASGALVKCRKVGAKNWGNKSKKSEGLDLDDNLLQIIEEEYRAVIKERKISQQDNSKIKKIIDQLENSSKMHGEQAEYLKSLLEKEIQETISEKKKKRKKRKGGKKDGKGASDKGYTLRNWFAGGGWVQTGGKYDGKPCAKQPGQKTKPYCRDPDDRAKLSKKERDKRAAKKRKEDPNPNRKGKAKNVSQKKGK